MRRLIIGVLCVLCLLQSGCSTLRFAYGQASTLAYWTLDGYADFDDVQAPAVRASLDRWLQWHRTNELPLYADMLARGEAQVPDAATPAQACRWYDEILARIDAASEQLVQPAAALAATLSASQVGHIERKYAQKNAEFIGDYLQDKPADRASAIVKKTRERFEMLYGDLDDSQQRLLARSVAQSPFDPQRWLAEKKARQQELLALLRREIAEPLPPAKLQAEVRTVLNHALVSPSDAYRDYMAGLTQFNCGLTAQMHNAMTPQQRRVAAERLRGWLADVRALSASR